VHYPTHRLGRLAHALQSPVDCLLDDSEGPEIYALGSLCGKDPQVPRFLARQTQNAKSSQGRRSGRRKTSGRIFIGHLAVSNRPPPAGSDLLQHQHALPIAPPTPPTLPNFLENTLVPCRFRCIGGVGWVGPRRRAVYNEAKVKTPVAFVVPPNDLGSREIKHHRATSLLAG
jgi:hypothetical protein